MNKNNNILKDKIQDKILEKYGYAVIPFLNKEEVEDLSSFFYKNHKEIPKGLYATAHSQDIDFRNKMNTKIKEVFERANNENFENIQALGGTFMNKSKGKEGLLQPHQDWNIVDEEQYRSFNVWVPLVDVSKENGTIQILDRSHKFPKTFRGINIPSAYEDLNEICWDKMLSIEMKAGQALVYDHRLLHASKENFTNENRLVVVYGIIPKDAEMRYYYKENNKIAEYKCSPDFFMNGNPAGGPNGLEKIKDIDFIENPWKNINSMFETITNKKEVVTLNFWEKIKNKFKL